MIENPQELFDKADEETAEVKNKALEAVNHFIDNESKVYGIRDAVETVQEEIDVEVEMAVDVVHHLASDGVDPLVHVVVDGERYVTVSNYTEGEWWYGYEDYDDIKGKGRKVVCCQCVLEDKHPRDVGKVFEKDISGEFSSYSEMSEWLMEKHFDKRHPDTDPSEVGVHIGASLASGTTVGGNTAWHQGNVAPVDKNGDTMAGTLTIDASTGVLVLPNSSN